MWCRWSSVLLMMSTFVKCYCSYRNSLPVILIGSSRIPVGSQPYFKASITQLPRLLVVGDSWLLTTSIKFWNLPKRKILLMIDLSSFNPSGFKLGSFRLGQAATLITIANLLWDPIAKVYYTKSYFIFIDRSKLKSCCLFFSYSVRLLAHVVENPRTLRRRPPVGRRRLSEEKRRTQERKVSLREPELWPQGLSFFNLALASHCFKHSTQDHTLVKCH